MTPEFTADEGGGPPSPSTVDLPQSALLPLRPGFLALPRFPALGQEASQDLFPGTVAPLTLRRLFGLDIWPPLGNKRVGKNGKGPRDGGSWRQCLGPEFPSSERAVTPVSAPPYKLPLSCAKLCPRCALSSLACPLARVD